eukprot:1161362-Pelagomonas_calceolata.AAC.1
MTSTSARCPYCGEIVSMNHIALRYLNLPANGMHTNRQQVGLSFCVKALNKGRCGSSLIGMDACQNERLLEQDIEVPENISRAILDCFFPNGTGSSARNQSRPDAVLCALSQADPHMLIRLRSSIHLVEFKFCPDPNPFPTLEAATAQHTNTTIRLKIRSLRNPNRKNKVTLHIILVGVAGTIYNDYTIKPLTNLGSTSKRLNH